jgi:hypothetical protein
MCRKRRKVNSSRVIKLPPVPPPPPLIDNPVVGLGGGRNSAGDGDTLGGSFIDRKSAECLGTRSRWLKNVHL